MSDPTGPQIKLSDLVAHFEKIKAQQGEEAYQKARLSFALSMVLKPRGAAFVAQAFPDMDIEALRLEAQKLPPHVQAPAGQNPQDVMLNAMRQQIPNLKTQAQFNVFMASFDALRHTLNSAFGQDRPAFEKAKGVLNQALDAAFQISSIVEQLRTTPEAATSAAAAEFKNPPREFEEYDVQKSLLVELGTKLTVADLQNWYDSNRARIDTVVSQTLRNELFDAIRNRKHELAQGETS